MGNHSPLNGGNHESKTIESDSVGNDECDRVLLISHCTEWEQRITKAFCRMV